MLFTWIVKTCQRHLSRLTSPALLGLFIGQYLLCYLVLRLLRESALVSQLSDFIYYCSVVGSTLGFGDLSPQTAPDVCSPRCGKFRLASGCSAR